MGVFPYSALLLEVLLDHLAEDHTKPCTHQFMHNDCAEPVELKYVFFFVDQGQILFPIVQASHVP